MKTKIIIGFLIGIFLISLISAQGALYCCEKTTDGAWCQNQEQTDCDTNYKSVPTSCESTSYCKLGTCVNTKEGTCMENTPERVCNEKQGVWSNEKSEDLPQCRLGCCLMGTQAAFVTQTRCKSLSSLYGLEINYRTDIKSEIQCISSAVEDVEGACVFEKEYERTCDFITQKKCVEMQGEFHKNYLCSAEELETNCGKSRKTTCVEGKDEVYFVDLCGNIANIYDSSKINVQSYWEKVIPKSESCGVSDLNGNAGSNSCGNCDYYLGSVCKQAKRGESPKYGENICADLSCKYEEKIYQHGETWCAESKGTSEIILEKDNVKNLLNENLPGSRYFRLVCYNGEVTVEPCADFRQEVCVQSDINGFKTAACTMNKWQDCVLQAEQEDCENTEQRDCKWVKGYAAYTKKSMSSSATCVPKYAPGFDFWEAEGDAEGICSISSVTCIVNYEKGLFSKKWEVVGDKTCLDDDKRIIKGWENSLTNICSSLGDCGVKENYLGKDGSSTKSQFKIK